MTVYDVFEYFNLPMWCFDETFVEYIFIGLLLFGILYFHINTSMFTPIFWQKKTCHWRHETVLNFSFSVSCYFEILDLYILAIFGFGWHLYHWLMLTWEPGFLYCSNTPTGFSVSPLVRSCSNNITPSWIHMLH